MNYYVCGEGGNPPASSRWSWCSSWVEHALTMLANTMEESAGEPQKEGALRCVERTGALGHMGGQTA